MMYGNAPPGPPGAPPPGGYGPPPPGYGPPPPPGGYALGPPGNPYAAPQAVAAVSGPLVPAGSGMKWLYVAGWAGCWLFSIAGYTLIGLTSSGPGDDPGGLIALPIIGAFFLVLVPIGALVWLYKAWASIPPDMRYTDSGKAMTPGSAIGFLFIPLFNLYWVFVANVGLCEAVNRTLVSRGGQPRAPKGLAIAACIAHLVPYCNLLVSPILWTIYMVMLDGARKDMVNRVGATSF